MNEKVEQKEIKGVFDILKKSLSMSINVIIDNLPFTITMIYFKILDKPSDQEIIGLATTFFTFFFRIPNRNPRGYWN